MRRQGGRTLVRIATLATALALTCAGLAHAQPAGMGAVTLQLPAPTGPHHYWVITDYAAMAPQLQAAGLMSDDDRVKLIGAIAPAQSVPVIRSFFDRHL